MIREALACWFILRRSQQHDTANVNSALRLVSVAGAYSETSKVRRQSDDASCPLRRSDALRDIMEGMNYPPSGPVLWGILGIVGGWLLLAIIIELIDRRSKSAKKTI